MCGDQIKAVEQKGVAQNTVALMRWCGKELRGEQNVQTATILFSSFFPSYLWNISVFFLHPVNLPPPPLGNEWISKSSGAPAALL